MAFAPYSNNHRNEDQPRILGCFVEVEHGNTFEYAENTDTQWVNPSEWPHKVFVGPMGEQTRYARVLKTVAHVIVDEDENGFPVVEKWKIKSRRDYA